jgi:hypothetical protein
VKHFAEKLMLMALCGSVAGWLTHVIFNDPTLQELRFLPILFIALTLIIARFIRHRGDLEKSFMVVAFGSALMTSLTAVAVVIAHVINNGSYIFARMPFYCVGLILYLISVIFLIATGTKAVRERHWGNMGIVILLCYVVTVILPLFATARER